MRGISVGPIQHSISDGAICVLSGHQVSESRDFTVTGGDPNVTLASAAVPTIFATGTPVQVENSGGALPTGLSAATIYYAIYVNATTVRLATSYANALAGTVVTPSAAGSGTHTVSVCVKDQSGNNVHGYRGAALTLAELWAVANYATTQTGTSDDTITVPGFNAYWNSPATQTVLLFWRWIVPGFPVATGKRFLGNGESAASKGLRVRTHSATSGRFQVLVGSSTQQFSPASSAEYGHATNNRTMAIVLDGPRSRLHCYVNGTRDATLGEVVLTGDLTDMQPFGQTFRIGGSNVDTVEANWHWFQAYRRNGAAPSNLDDLVMRLHTTKLPFAQSEWQLNP